jgi:hypothetical protein
MLHLFPRLFSYFHFIFLHFSCLGVTLSKGQAKAKPKEKEKKKKSKRADDSPGYELSRFVPAMSTLVQVYFMFVLVFLFLLLCVSFY